MKDEHKDRLALMLAEHKEKLRVMKLDFYERCKGVQVNYSNVVANAKHYGQNFIESLQKKEEENNQELEGKIRDIKSKITALKSDNEKYMREFQDNNRRHADLKKEDELLQKQFEE